VPLAWVIPGGVGVELVVLAVTTVRCVRTMRSSARRRAGVRRERSGKAPPAAGCRRQRPVRAALEDE